MEAGRSQVTIICVSPLNLRIAGSLRNWDLGAANTQTPVLLDAAIILALWINNISNGSFCFCLCSLFPTGSCQGLEFFFFLVTLPFSSLSLGRGTLAQTLLSFHQTSPRGSHLGSAFSQAHLTCSFLSAPSADLLWAPQGLAPPVCLRLLPLLHLF